MKRLVLMAATIAACASVPAIAADDDDEFLVTIDQLQAKPNDYLRTDIVVRGMACKLDDDNEYTCILPGKGKSLVIHAQTLSYGTSVETSLQFGDECRGEKALTRKSCIYDVRTTPREIRSKTVNSGLMIMSFGYALDLMPPKAVKKR